jgi:DNA-directed RNA polymerase specialized sigma24 family protein
MAAGDDAPITLMLRRWCGGDSDALNAIYEQIGRELKSIAHFQLRKSRGGIDLCTLELVDEVLLRFIQLSKDRDTCFESRLHFLKTFAVLARNAYCDEVRRAFTKKRGEGQGAVMLDYGDVADDRAGRFWSLNLALDRLEKKNEKAYIVFVYNEHIGLSVEEIADFLKVSRQAATSYKKIAKVFLAQEIGKIDPAVARESIVAPGPDQ